MDVLCVDKTGTLTMNRLDRPVRARSRVSTQDDADTGAGLEGSEAGPDRPRFPLYGTRAWSRPEPRLRPLVRFTPINPGTRRTEAVIEVEGRLSLP